MKKSVQETLAKATKKSPASEAPSKPKEVTKAPAKGTKGKTEKTSQKPSEETREAYLKLAREAGLKVETKTSWHKVTGSKKGLALYVAKKGPQVHLSGFTVKSPHVEQVSET